MPQGKGAIIKPRGVAASLKATSAVSARGAAPPVVKITARAAAAAAAPARIKKRGREPSPPSEDEEDEEALEGEEDEEFDEEDEELDDDIDFDDVDEDEEGDDEGDDEEDDEEDEDDFEAKAARFKRMMQAQTREAAEEMASERAAAAKSTVLSDAEAAALEEENDGALRTARALEGIGLLKQSATVEELRERIKETVRVLSRFRDEREEGRNRDEYVQLLRHDLMELFEYNDFLMDVILDMFPPHEAVEFLEAMEKPRPTTIRVNTIKAKRRDLVQTLVKRGMNVEALEKWSKVGLQVFESNVPIAGTVEYLAGHYMLQSAVSFLPVVALAPEENERVLDMSAAPGGKTTYIAQLMKNTGVIFANDVSEPRCKSLNANLQRLGVVNAIVTNYDGIGYEKVMRNFNRVLLDAPCTGSGIISRDKSIKTSKSYEDVQRASQLQRRLLLSAIDCAKVGGFVVYSTCSFLVEEDEAVVDYALRRRNVRIVDMGLPFGRPGMVKYRHSRYDPSVQHSRRYFPHVHNMDGFYVCKFEKLGDGVRSDPSAAAVAAADEAAAEVRDPVAAAARRKERVAARRAAATAAAGEEAKNRTGATHSANVSVPPSGARLVPRGTKAPAAPTTAAAAPAGQSRREKKTQKRAKSAAAASGKARVAGRAAVKSQRKA